MIHSNVKHYVCDIPITLASTFIEDIISVTTPNSNTLSIDPWVSHKPSDIVVQICFLKLIATLLSGYHKFIGYTWIADDVIPHFYEEEFIFSKPPEQTKFLSQLLQTQTFKYFIETNTKNPFTVFHDWNFNNIHCNDIISILHHYNIDVQKQMQNPQQTQYLSKSLNTSSSTILLSKLHITNSLQKQQFNQNELKQPINYQHKFDNLQMQSSNQQKQYKSTFIEQLIQINNQNIRQKMEMGNLFDELSTQQQRYIFLTHLHQNLSSFILPTYKSNTLSEFASMILVDVLKNVATFCSSQQDTLNGYLILRIINEIYIIHNLVEEPISIFLSELPLWEESRIWVLYFLKRINETKTHIYPSTSLQSIPQLSYCGHSDNTKYYDKECSSAIAVIHQIAKTMNSMKLKSSFVTNVISRITAMLPLQDSTLQELRSILKVISSVPPQDEVIRPIEMYGSIFF
ncbi:Uncharacterized protein QTN25_001828 [Entamoeba marina]